MEIGQTPKAGLNNGGEKKCPSLWELNPIRPAQSHSLLPIHTQKMVEFSVDVGHGLDKNTTI
jgi:hypothetical protein